jgi:hypothetical protein
VMLATSLRAGSTIEMPSTCGVLSDGLATDIDTSPVYGGDLRANPIKPICWLGWRKYRLT